MATELKILTSNSTRPVLDALIPAYEKSTGNKVSLIADSAKAMVERIKGGETGDIVVLDKAASRSRSRLAPGFFISARKFRLNRSQAFSSLIGNASLSNSRVGARFGNHTS